MNDINRTVYRIKRDHEEDIYNKIKFNTHRTIFNKECMPNTRNTSLVVTVMTSLIDYLDDIC